ncbi:MAG: hypothetical protein Ta2D_05280 [Rickettsiales bacterium]|nr:MAG: hypothetical protein Ta2D_05280 [Rickettsiales bacterium]
MINKILNIIFIIFVLLTIFVYVAENDIITEDIAKAIVLIIKLIFIIPPLCFIFYHLIIFLFKLLFYSHYKNHRRYKIIFLLKWRYIDENVFHKKILPAIEVELEYFDNKLVDNNSFLKEKNLQPIYENLEKEKDKYTHSTYHKEKKAIYRDEPYQGFERDYSFLEGQYYNKPVTKYRSVFSHYEEYDVEDKHYKKVKIENDIDNIISIKSGLFEKLMDYRIKNKLKKENKLAKALLNVKAGKVNDNKLAIASLNAKANKLAIALLNVKAGKVNDNKLAITLLNAKANKLAIALLNAKLNAKARKVNENKLAIASLNAKANKLAKALLNARAEKKYPRITIADTDFFTEIKAKVIALGGSPSNEIMATSYNYTTFNPTGESAIIRFYIGPSGIVMYMVAEEVIITSGDRWSSIYSSTTEKPVWTKEA